jgi:putative nucleotidyltransferase with HDIG domain
VCVIEVKYVILRKYMSTRVIKPGMILEQTIADRADRVLIARGTQLDEYLVESMRKMGITGVYIRTGVIEDKDTEEQPVITAQVQQKIDQRQVKDRAKVHLSESVKKRVAEGIQYLYQDTESSNFMDVTRSITNDLVKAIDDNDAIAVDISALKVSDEYTFKHSVDVATMAMIVSRQYGFNDEQVQQIGVSGLLHDIGKSRIPTEVLNKAQKLTDEEFALIKKHSLLGYEILKDKPELSNAVKMGVLQHHEKINGSGYPMGVTEEQIHIFAKIIAVTDIYDALVTERPYKKAFTPRNAVEMIMAMTGELDLQVMQSFLESVILYPVGTNVDLSNGEKARVVANNPKFVLRPTVVGLNSGRVYELSTDLNCANIIIL